MTEWQKIKFYLRNIWRLMSTLVWYTAGILVIVLWWLMVLKWLS